LGQLQKVHKQLADLGYQIIAVSPDRPAKVDSVKGKSSLDYVLLSDTKLATARALGVAFKLDDDTVSKYAEFGIDLQQASGESHHMLPVPSIFVFGTDARIKFEYVNPNYQVRIDPDTLLAAARAALR
jgi:peroxiredoxin